MDSNFLEKISSKPGFIKNKNNEKIIYIPSNIKNEDILKYEDNKLFFKDGSILNSQKINNFDMIRKFNFL